MSGVSLITPEMLVAGSIEALSAKPRRALDEKDIALLAEVSSILMKDSQAKAFPDVLSFAFWCRKGHLKKLAAERDDLSVNMGRGLAFHVAPSNVPVNFAFSWAFSLLAGNSNIVRIPSKPFPQVKLICDAIDKAMKSLGDTRSIFVSYPSESQVTERLSAIADVRVLWGGDATVSNIRGMTSRPRCIDIAFADRYSIAVMDANAIEEADGAAVSALVRGFYNDTYLMDQNACSSPMAIVWLNVSAEGKSRFWSAVYEYAASEYRLQGAVATDKYVQLCRDAIEGRLVGPVEYDGLLDVVDINSKTIADGALDQFRGKGGYFYEFDAMDFSEVVHLLGRTCQTVTYYGVDPVAIRETIIANGSCGVDRIVPVGKAMDIDIVWDGMDLLSMMSRRIDVR